MKKIHKIGLSLCIMIIVSGAGYFGYYKYQQSQLQFYPPEGFSVEVEMDAMMVIAEEWLEAYAAQYQRKYVPRKLKIDDYVIEGIEVKEANVIQINFSIDPKVFDEANAARWEGIIEDKEINSHWVLTFDAKRTEAGTSIYTVTKLQRPAGYDLEIYQSSGEKEIDEYKYEYEAEIPYEEQSYTYKIENRLVFVSYDTGSSWKEVPVPLETLVEVGDGRAYYNQLQENSFLITPKKTAFVYGGTRDTPLKMTYSEDMGDTWKTSIISESVERTRVKFCSFPTHEIGYIIVGDDRTMSQERQIIYQTTNGGEQWKEVGFGPSTWLVQSAGFVDENLGFMSYPKVEGADSNLYRTEDGGKTFEPVELPVHVEKWLDFEIEPFIQPEVPYMEDGQLYLLIGQGELGDFKGGKVMAKYKSDDNGKTWIFVELVEPLSEELG